MQAEKLFPPLRMTEGLRNLIRMRKPLLKTLLEGESAMEMSGDKYLKAKRLAVIAW